MTSNAFLSAVLAAAARIGMTPDALLRVWFFESAGLNPAAISPDKNHFGLNQLAGSWLTTHGVDPYDYITWTDLRQLPIVMMDVRERMKQFNGGRPFSDAVMYYIVNLLPVAYAKATSEDAVIMQDGDPWYSDNKGLDVGGKGTITVADIRTKMDGVLANPKYQALLARMQKIASSGRGGAAGVVAVGFATALGAFFARRKG